MTPRALPSPSLVRSRTHRGLATLAGLALVPLAAVVVPSAPAAAADPVVVADGGPACLEVPGGEWSTGIRTTDYVLPEGTVGVRAFLHGQSGTGFGLWHRDSPELVYSHTGGRGADIVVDVPAAEGTSVVLGTLPGGTGGVPTFFQYVRSTGAAPGGDGAFIARAGDRCNDLLAVAAGGGGAGGGHATTINGQNVAGADGGDAGLLPDGSGARPGGDGAGNSAKDGAGGLPASLTGDGRGGARGTNWKDPFCPDGNHGSAGRLLGGGRGGDAGADGECAGTGGGGGGGAGLHGGGGGGSAASGSASGAGGGGASWVDPAITIVRSELTDRRDQGAPGLIPIYQPTVGVTASAASVAYGGSLTLTARLGSVPADSRGRVTFLNGRGFTLAADSVAEVVDGRATYTLRNITSREPLTFKAFYQGETDESSHINLEAFSPVTSPVVVGKEALPVTVSATQTYGGAPTYTRSLTAPDGVTVAGSAECRGVTGSSGGLEQLDVGSYTLDAQTCSGLTLSGPNAGDYVLTYTGGDLAVTPAPLSIRVDGSASFGDAPDFYTPGLPGGLTVGTDLSCTLADGTAPDSSLPVGSYPLAACTGLDFGGPAAGNYTPTLVPGTLYVGTTSVLVEPSGGRVWDGAVAPFTHTVQGGLPRGVSIDGELTCRTVNGGFPLAETDRDTQRTVGTYTIDGASCSGLSLAGERAGGYQLTVLSGPFVVTPTVVPVVLTGGLNHGGEASFVPAADLPAGFSLHGTATCTRAAGAPLAELAVSGTAYLLDGDSCSGLSVAGPRNQGANFAVTYSGTVRVADPDPVDVKVDLTQAYGGTPSFTGASFYDANPGHLVISGQATCANVLRLEGSLVSVPITRDLTGGQHQVDGASCSGLAVNAPDGTRVPISYTGTLSVSEAELTVTAPSFTRTYRETVPALEAAYDGFVLGQTEADLQSPPICRTTGVDGSTIGHYPGASTCSGGYASNYRFTYVAGDVTVIKRPLTITAPDVRVAYGDLPAVTPNQLQYDGFATGWGDNWTTALGEAPTCAIDPDAAAVVGTHDGAVTCSGATATNYDIGYVAGSLTVTGEALVVTAPDATKVYGAPLPVLTPTYDGLTGGDTVASGTPATCSTDATATSPVGTYAVTCRGAAVAGYGTSYVAGTLEVTRAPLTVTARDATTTYGNTVPAIGPAYDGFRGTDTAEGSLSTPPTCVAEVTSRTLPGTYATAATCSGAASGNYAITYVPGTVSVAPRALTVTAPSPRATYGSPPPTLSPSYAGFAAGDSVSTMTTRATCAASASAMGRVGTHPVSCAGAEAAGYEIGYAPGSLTVAKAPLTITASGGTAVFGDPMPASTPSYEGFVGGDTAATALTTAPTCETTLSPIVRPGRYDDGAECFGAVAHDYAITYAPGVVTITRAALEVTAPSPSVVYGQSLPVLAPAYAGFVADDAAGDLVAPATCTTTATAGSPVGTYPVTCAGASSPRYDVGYVAGTLTITKAPLTITASSLVATTGGPLPAVTPSYSGFVHGDTAAMLTTAPSCVSTVASDAALGLHRGAAVCRGAASTDYDIIYVAGDVTLVAVPSATVRAADRTITRGGAMPALMATYTGAGPGDFTTLPTCTTTATPTSPAGDYPITCAGGVSPGFALYYTPGRLTLLAARADRTVAASAGGPVGATAISATATLSGVGVPAGSVTFALHGPDDTRCTGVPVASSTVRLVGGAATSAPFRPVAAGTYRWTAAYSGDDGHLPFADSCAVGGDVVMTAPLVDTRIVGGPADGDRTTETTADFAYTATGGPVSGFECSLDGAPFRACDATGTTVRDLEVGVHTFAVRAIGADGVADATPSEISWRVLEPAPQTRIVSTRVTRRAVTLELASTSRTATFSCRLDGGEWSACGATPTFRGLAGGVHRIRVRATNASGVSDPSPAVTRFRIAARADRSDPA